MNPGVTSFQILYLTTKIGLGNSMVSGTLLTASHVEHLLQLMLSKTLITIYVIIENA